MNCHFIENPFCTLLTLAVLVPIVPVIVDNSSFSVEIITVGNINVFSLGSIPLVGPAIDLAVGEILQKYSSVFHLEHTYLFDKSALTCEDVDTVSDNLLAEHYYRRRSSRTPNMTALIIPGTCNTLYIHNIFSVYVNNFYHQIRQNRTEQSLEKCG